MITGIVQPSFIMQADIYFTDGSSNGIIWTQVVHIHQSINTSISSVQPVKLAISLIYCGWLINP